MMSATVAGGCGDWDGAWGAGASAMTAPYGGSWVGWGTMRASSTREPLLSLRNTWRMWKATVWTLIYIRSATCWLFNPWATSLRRRVRCRQAVPFGDRPVD